MKTVALSAAIVLLIVGLYMLLNHDVCIEKKEASFSQQGPEDARTQTRVETVTRTCR